MKKNALLLLLLMLSHWIIAQQGRTKLKGLEWEHPGAIQSLELEQGNELSVWDIPLGMFSMEVNDKRISAAAWKKRDEHFELVNGLWLQINEVENHDKGALIHLQFINNSKDTLSIKNLVPFEADSNKVYLTGMGDHRLSRTHLFRPGYAPVNVIMPDNSWEAGFSSLSLPKTKLQLVGLARRVSWENATRQRFETQLHPGGALHYTIYADVIEGTWHDALELMFRERWLYDLEAFDNSLFEREDLSWIKHKYIAHLIMAWDKDFYDYRNKAFGLVDFLERGQKLYGGNDVIGIWPTWPALGLDQRNQWDLFRDLPGGTSALRSFAQKARSQGTHLFISYNPWDESTRMEDHLQGMARLIQETDADGVVLDTRGASSKELQEEADQVKKGVVMYSEGMAVPKDMPGIVSGRVHNALYYPPLLNLNKFIKPDFAIFRVAELTYERIRREYNLSLFNGYGIEINQFRPGKPEWIEEDYRYLGRIAMVLRRHSHLFTSYSYTPLVPTKKDSVYVNHWKKGDQELFTVFSLHPEGLQDPLVELNLKSDHHWVDVFHYEPLEVREQEGKNLAVIKTDAFHKSALGTNNEGAVTAFGQYPKLIKAHRSHFDLKVETAGGDKLLIWAGNPGYDKTPWIVPADSIQTLDLYSKWGAFEGKLVIELLDKEERLLDIQILNIPSGIPRLLAKKTSKKAYKTAPEGMVKVPAGIFTKKSEHGDDFILYPENDSLQHPIPGFFMDIQPVSNQQFKVFLERSGYQPSDTLNFLKHWENGTFKKAEGNYPVVYINKEDAEAYAEWAGKRLPSELEWQYAAQYPDGRLWPWGNTFDSTRSNTGDNLPYSLEKYAEAKSELGLLNLVGNVWQLTSDEYESSSYRFIILKGGSFFKPLSSWWYVQGGPKNLQWQQMLLRVAPGFERNATVGFRCVADESLIDNEP
jgi:formylglycine-generating enzyme required for sulfatase activity